ncbi:MAG: glycosyltransferase [Nanoarchaeota archaeon]
MNIAIFTDTFLPQINGVVTATLSLAKGLADRGHKVHIIAPKFNNPPQFKHKNIRLKLIPGIRAGFYEDFKFTLFLNPVVFSYIHKKKIDIIHFQTPLTLGWESIICSKIFKKPLVGTFHTIFSDPEYLKHAGLASKTVEKMAWSYAAFFYNMCNKITAPSEKTRKELKEKAFNRTIEVISNGIEFNFNNTKRNNIKKKYSLSKTLLYVGRIAHEKSITQLLEAFNELTKWQKDVKLMLVGGGPQEDEVQKKIKEQGLEDRVIMTGAIPHEKLVKSGIYGACDIFVTASKTETQGITLLEGMANGMPCVGVNKRGVAEVIKHEKNGLLVHADKKKEFAKACYRLLNDKELYNRLSKGAEEEIKTHDIKHVLDKWEKLYDSIQLNK